MKPGFLIPVLILTILVLTGCAQSTALPTSTVPTSTPLSITVNGAVIALVPGENILPEIYEAAKSPEMLENSDWVFVDGYWDLMTKGVTIPLEVEEPLLEAATKPLFPGFPENWESISLPELGAEFDYPSGWQVEPYENGLHLFPLDGSYSIRVVSHPNPVEASLQIWLAEFAPDLPGEVLAEFEDTIGSKPVLRQQVLLAIVEGSPTGESIYLWMDSGERIFHWVAWPGDQPETYDLLMYMASTLQQ